MEQLHLRHPIGFTEDKHSALELMVDQHTAILDCDVGEHNHHKDPQVTFESTRGPKGVVCKNCVGLSNEPVHTALCEI